MKSWATFSTAVLLAILPFIPLLPGGGDVLVGLPAENPPIPGDSDVYEQAWHFWWVGRTISEGADPRVCPLIGLPAPYSLVGQNIGWPDAILFGTLPHITPSRALFAALLSGSLLAFVAGFLLARSWGLGWEESLFAALMIAWAPPRTAHLLQHYQVAGVGWLLLSLAALRSSFNRKSAAKLAAFGICGFLASMETPYHSLLFVVGSVLTVFAAPSSGPRLRVILAAAAACTLAIIAGLVFYASFPGPLPAPMNPGESLIWSAEPLSLLLPSPFGSFGLLSGWNRSMPWMPNLFEGVITPGFIVLLLALIALFRRGAGGLAGNCGSMKRLVILSVIPMILAMGPMLKLLGVPSGIPLPYALFQNLPLMGGARSPSRFALLGSFMLAVPAASVLGTLRRKLRIPIVALALFEIIPPFLPTLPAGVPSIYRDGCSSGSVLEIPASPVIRRYALFMTEDGQERPVFFQARREEPLPERFAPFLTESSGAATLEQARVTGVDAIVYNRWMFNASWRGELDIRFAELFPGASADDSVWIWRR